MIYIAHRTEEVKKKIFIYLDKISWLSLNP